MARWPAEISGRIINGQESSGKDNIDASISYCKFEAGGGAAAFIDAEHALRSSARRIWGVDTEEFVGFSGQITLSSIGDYRDAQFVRTRWIL